MLGRKSLQFNFSCKSEKVQQWKYFHTHEEVEFGMMTKGQMKFSCSGKVFDLEEHELILFWASCPHRILESRRASQYTWVTIPFGVFVSWGLPKMLIEYLLRGQVLTMKDQKSGEYDSYCFHRWVRDFKISKLEAHKVALMEIKARIFRLSGDRLKGVEKPSEKDLNIRYANKIEQVHRFICQNFRKALSHVEIANAVCLHPNYLVSMYRKHCGVGIHETISRMRIGYAQSLLLHQNMKIVDVAFQSGFGSVSSFYECFKKECHQSPSAYRKHFLNYFDP